MTPTISTRELDRLSRSGLTAADLENLDAQVYSAYGIKPASGVEQPS